MTSLFNALQWPCDLDRRRHAPQDPQDASLQRVRCTDDQEDDVAQVLLRAVSDEGVPEASGEKVGADPTGADWEGCEDVMEWTVNKPVVPGLYWWRWGIPSHDSEYPDGAEIVRVWVQPRVADITGPIWWVTHFDKEETKVELRFTDGDWWLERIKTPEEQGG